MIIKSHISENNNQFQYWNIVASYLQNQRQTPKIYEPG